MPVWPNLTVLLHPARVNDGTGAGDVAAQGVGQILHHGHLLGAADAAAAGDQDLGVGDVLGHLGGLDGLQHLHVVGGGDVQLDDLAGAAGVGSQGLHHAGADSGHLGTVLQAGDGGDDVAAEGGRVMRSCLW